MIRLQRIAPGRENESGERLECLERVYREAFRRVQERMGSRAALPASTEGTAP